MDKYEFHIFLTSGRVIVEPVTKNIADQVIDIREEIFSPYAISFYFTNTKEEDIVIRSSLIENIIVRKISGKNNPSEN